MRCSSFGVGLAVGGALWGNCNWGGGNTDVNIEHHSNYSKNVNRSNVASERTARYQQGQTGNRSQWSHSPEHRQGVQYRDQATQQRYNKAANPQAVQSREAYRGYGGEQGRGDAGRAAGAGGGAGAYQGMGSGGDARNYSNRGQTSRQTMGAGGGYSGGSRPTPTAGGGGGRSGGGGARGGGRR